MILEKIKIKVGATRPTARQYESVRADIELEVTMDEQNFTNDWKRKSLDATRNQYDG